MPKRGKMPRKKESGKKKDKKRKQLMLLGMLVLMLIIIDVSMFFIKYHPSINFSANKNVTAIVTNVTDGDTFQIDNGRYVRLIGINTPEQGFIGYAEAKQFLTLLILNKEVTLEKDISETDSYGRLLRYVYVQQAGQEVFVNSELVKLGYARLMPVEPDTSKQQELAAAAS